MKVSEWATEMARKIDRDISYDRKIAIIAVLAAAITTAIMIPVFNSLEDESAHAAAEPIRKFGSVEYNLLSDRVAHLEGDIRNLKKEISDLKEEVLDLSMNTSYLKGYVTTLNEKINSNTTKIRNHVK